MSNELPKASVLYPTVLDDELIMTRRGLVPREKNKFLSNDKPSTLPYLN